MPDTVAVVTGGAGGMGLATARILGRDHRVVISDVKQDALASAVAGLAELGIEADGVAADITDRASVDALFAKAGSLGQVTSVVHTAGVSPQMGSADFIIKVNALGTVNVTEATLAIAGEGLALVNVASIAGHMTPSFLVPRRAYKLAFTDSGALAERLARTASRGPASMRSGSAYSLSKNFAIWYTAKMAAAFGAKGARILSVSPGSFDTAMGRLEEDSGSGKLIEYSALKRFGKPEEVAELLAFCASGKPGYLTGVDILCDGGTRAGLNLRGMIAMARNS
jgi:NAD(P)-dependent dehydrogenase (short-subunit alcohol dehydrogenase family)